MINVVITMGGIGKRFLDAGYSIPKYMIEAKGRTLFEWSLISLDAMKDHVEKYIFVVLKNDKVDVEEFITNNCKSLGLKNFSIIVLDSLTDGQATSALMAKEYWNREEGLLVYNIDTYVEPGEMTFEELHGDGFIPCFNAPGDHWSFVRLDDTGKVVEIKEKERISDHCTVGAYYFKTCGLYEQMYKEYYIDLKSEGVGRNKEKYIAPIYDYMISIGKELYISNIPCDKVHVLGTPEELLDFIEQ